MKKNLMQIYLKGIFDANIFCPEKEKNINIYST